MGCRANNHIKRINVIQGTCWKRLRIMLTHGDACTLEHTVTLPNIGVYCAVQYSGADCPLGPDPVVCCCGIVLFLYHAVVF